MDVDLRGYEIRILVAIGFIIGMVIGPGVMAVFAGFLSNSAEVSGTIPLNATSGPNVHYTEGSDMNLTDPFPNSNTVEIRAGSGNITVVSSGGGKIVVQNSVGVWTNVTGIVSNGDDIKINPKDKQAANASADIDTLNFTEMGVDDGEVDFVYSGDTGTSNVTAFDLQPDLPIDAVDAGTGDILATATSNSNGKVEFTGLPNSKHIVELQQSENAGPPYVDAISPEDGAFVDDLTVMLEATVKDPDKDDIDVTIFLDDDNDGTYRQVHQVQNVTSGNNVSTSVTAGRGENKWKLQLDDDANPKKNTTAFTFFTPGQLTIWNGTDDTLANDTTITVEFTSFESDFKQTNTTTTGKLNLTGLPNEDIRAELSGTNYTNQTLAILDVSKSYDPVMYEEDPDGFRRCFALDDQTGSFVPHNTSVIISARIDGKWRHVASDRFGSLNEAFVGLSNGTDYRMTIVGGDGDRRSIAGFTADEDVTGCRPIVLTVGETADEIATNDYRWNAYKTEDGNIFWYINFAEDVGAKDLVLIIYERGNPDNRIRQLVFGRVGKGSNLTHTEILTTDQSENKTWVVQWNASINGSQESGERIIGPERSTQWGGLPPWIRLYSSIMLILMTAASVSRADAAAGAVVVPIVAGLLWYIGWMSSATLTGGTLALALGIALVFKIKEGQV